MKSPRGTGICSYRGRNKGDRYLKIPCALTLGIQELWRGPSFEIINGLQLGDRILSIRRNWTKNHKSGVLEINLERNDLLTLLWISKKRAFAASWRTLQRCAAERLDLLHGVARNTDHEIFHLDL